MLPYTKLYSEKILINAKKCQFSYAESSAYIYLEQATSIHSAKVPITSQGRQTNLPPSKKNNEAENAIPSTNIE